MIFKFDTHAFLRAMAGAHVHVRIPAGGTCAAFGIWLFGYLVYNCSIYAHVHNIECS